MEKKAHDPLGQAPLKTVTAQISNIHIVQDVTGCQYASSKNIQGFFLLKSFAIHYISSVSSGRVRKLFDSWILQDWADRVV